MGKIVVRKKGSDPPKDAVKPELKANNILGMADRVSISFGQKIQVVQYEPVDINVFYSSDVLPNETVEEAFQRVTKVVETKAKFEISKIVAVKNGSKTKVKKKE